MKERKKRYYVGHADSGKQVFRSVEKPTDETHPGLFVIGPFKTKAGAQYAFEHGTTSVRAAERLANPIMHNENAPSDAATATGMYDHD